MIEDEFKSPAGGGNTPGGEETAKGRPAFTGFGSYTPGKGPVAHAPTQGTPSEGSAQTQPRDLSRPGMYGVDGTGFGQRADTEENAISAQPGGMYGGGGGAHVAAGFEGWRSDAWNGMVHFEGKGLDYFVLLLQNMLLSILTLGIYVFWGKVNIRKFLWKSTAIFGEPLEYTGTGKELFLGFLIVMPVLIVMTIATSFVIQYYPIAGELVWMVLFIYLWQYASYRTLRYRLTRTRWRGIRCNLAGNASSYAWKGTLYFLLMIVSMGLLAPFSLSRMISLKLNNVYFGTRKLDFSGTPGSMYRAIMAPFLGALLFGLVLFGTVIAAIVFSELVQEHGYEYYYAYHEMTEWLPTLLVFGLLGLVLFSSFFQAAMIRWIFRNMLSGEVHTRSTLSGATLLFTHFTNFLLVVFTLGIGSAWAHMRLYRATLNTIDYKGDPQLAELLQDTIAAPRYGEGLLEALDVDLAF